ncbi:MAG: SufS family cysteine desulfurase [Candidatus Shapirobacteria bacterium]
MNKYKKYFPIFENNPELVYLDSGATALKAGIVLDRMNGYYTEFSANINRGLYPMSEKATEEYEEVRKKVAKFLGAEHGSEIIFTGGATAGVNLVARSWGEENIEEEDEIVITEMEHHSNLVPWQELAKRKKAVLKFIEVDETYKLDLENLEKIINSKTKILALTQVSNVLGTINPIKEIIKKVKAINSKVVVLVDGAQAVAHMPVNVIDLDVDFYVFSGHKMYGPTGVGVLWTKAQRQLEMRPSIFGGGMIKEVTKEMTTYPLGPEAFEAGTPPIAQVVGLGAAIDFLESMSWKEILENEDELTKYTLKSLEKIPEIKIFGPISERVGVISMVLTGKNRPGAHDLGDILGRKFNVCIRSGHHCAMPLHHKFDLDYGTSRVSLGIYNEKKDIDKLIEAIKYALDIFNCIENG